MSEIKTDYSKAKRLLQELKQRTEELPTSHANPEFPTSELNFVDKIISIERSYYQSLNQYKKALLAMEADLQANLEQSSKKVDEQACQAGKS